MKADVSEQARIEAPDEVRAFDLQGHRLADLEEEVDALNKASGQLLIQRRKLHARIKSIVKSLLRSGIEVPADRVDAIEREIAAAAENALNLEVWLTEYRQITDTLTASNRELHRTAAAAMERAGALAAECDRLHGLAETLEAERLALALRVEREREELEQLRQRDGESAQLIGSLEGELSEARATTALPASTAVEDELRERLKQLEAKHQTLAIERERDRRNHAIEVAALTKQLSQLRERYDERTSEAVTRPAAGPRREPSTGGLRAAERPEAARPGHAAADRPPARPAPAAGAAPAAAGTVSPSAKPHEILLLDDEALGPEIGAQLSGAGFPVTAFVPRPGLVAQFPGASIATIAVNLALGETWSVLRTVRADSAFDGVTLVAYAAVPGGSSAFWFGPIEVLTQPLSPERLTAVLQRMSTRLKQVLMISHDAVTAEAIGKLLGKARIAVALARDRAQTLEAIKSIYPHVALVHPGSSPVDVFRAVAALRDVSLFRRIPLLFVLDQQPPAREETLYRTAVRTILRFGDTKLDELAPALAQAFGSRARR